MKKLTITLAMILSLLASAFASEENVKAEILAAFKNRFSTAQEVTWTSGKMFSEATFLFNGNWITAHFNYRAELIAVSRNITSDQLPYYLQNNLKKHRSAYWITELFELSNKDGYSHYVTLRNADEEIILESLNGRTWSTYRSTKLQ
jgi:hypothetical protein